MRSLWQARSNPLAWRWAFLTLSSNVNALGSGGLARGSRRLRPLEGLRDASTRWVVTHDFAQWKDEIAWMSLYFTAAVWASLALCLIYLLGDQVPRYRTEPRAQAPSFMSRHHATVEAHDLIRDSAYRRRV
jgi:hypothetical protein